MASMEDKFLSLEIDSELQKLKQELQNSKNQNRATYTTAHSQKEQTSAKNFNSNPPINEAKRVRFYAILGLPPDASMQEVKQAYKKLVKRCHPDLFFDNPSQRQKAQEILTKINQAYNELCSKNHL